MHDCLPKVGFDIVGEEANPSSSHETDNPTDLF